MPRAAEPAKTVADNIGDAVRPAEAPVARELDDEQPGTARGGSAAAGWPLEDFSAAAVARWGGRIAWLHPAMLIGAAVVGLLSGDLQNSVQDDPWLIYAAILVIYPAYLLLDATVNAQFIASSLRAFSLPLAQAAGNFFVSDEDIFLPSLLIAFSYLAMALLVMVIVRWHRMLQANEPASRVKHSGEYNSWLMKWGPKIGYAYLVVVAIHFLYDEGFNGRLSLISITWMYVMSVLVVAGLARGKRWLERRRD